MIFFVFVLLQCVEQGLINMCVLVEEDERIQ